jgi:hypothetical protein
MIHGSLEILDTLPQMVLLQENVLIQMKISSVKNLGRIASYQI